MNALILIAALGLSGTSEARKPKLVGATPSANAGEIPAPAERLDRTGWTPTTGAGTDCVQVQVDTENSIRDQQRTKAVAAHHRSLDMEYGSMGIERCQDRGDLARTTCVHRLESWISHIRREQSTVPGGTHQVPTACGPITVQLTEERVATRYDLSRAEAALMRLREPSLEALFSDALENFRSGDRARMRTSVGQFVEACESGEFAACQWAGNRHTRDDVVPVDHDRARALYTLGCDNGFGAACWELGLMSEKGQGGAEDLAHAYRTFKAACAKAHTPSCGRAANMLRNGEGTDADPTRAMALLLPLCEADHALSCSYLGWGWRDGTGVDKDAVKALGYYRKACALGSGHGCNEAGFLLDEGLGALSPDAAEASRLYARGCDVDHATSCFNLGSQYEAGEGITKSRDKADAFHQKACDLGKDDACQ